MHTQTHQAPARAHKARASRQRPALHPPPQPAPRPTPPGLVPRGYALGPCPSGRQEPRLTSVCAALTHTDGLCCDGHMPEIPDAFFSLCPDVGCQEAMAQALCSVACRNATAPPLCAGDFRALAQKCRGCGARDGPLAAFLPSPGHVEDFLGQGLLDVCDDGAAPRGTGVAPCNASRKCTAFFELKEEPSRVRSIAAG